VVHCYLTSDKVGTLAAGCQTKYCIVSDRLCLFQHHIVHVLEVMTGWVGDLTAGMSDKSRHNYQ